MEIFNLQNNDPMSNLTSVIENGNNSTASKVFDAVYAISLQPDENDVYRPNVKSQFGNYPPLDEILSTDSAYVLIKPTVGYPQVRLHLIKNDNRVRTATFTIGLNYGLGKIIDNVGSTTVTNDCILIFHHLSTSTYFIAVANDYGKQRYELLKSFRNGDLDSELYFISHSMNVSVEGEMEGLNKQMVAED
jgi:hypothetical protein